MQSNPAKGPDPFIARPFESLRYPGLVVFERNTLALGQSLDKLIRAQMASTPNRLALREAWLAPSRPSSELLQLRAEFSKHGVDLTDLLVSYALKTDSQLEATAAIKLLTSLNERQAVLERLIVPALQGGVIGTGSASFRRACAIGEHLNCSEMDRLIDCLDFKGLDHDPKGLARVAAGLHFIGGTTIVHSIVSRFERELAEEYLPTSAPMSVARAAQMVLTLAGRDRTQPWRLPDNLQSRVSNLYRHLPDCEPMRAFANLLMSSDPGAAEEVFEALLDELENGSDPMSRRFIVATHLAEAAIQLPGGEERIAERMERTDDPWIVAALCRSLAATSALEVSEGRFVLSESLTHEIEQGRAPRALATLVSMGPPGYANDILEYVLEQCYLPGRLATALNALSQCDYCRPTLTQSTIHFPEEAVRSDTFVVDLLEQIGAETLQYWMEEGSPSLRTNSNELLRIAYLQDTPRVMALRIDNVTMQSREPAATLMKESCGMTSEEDDVIR